MLAYWPHGGKEPPAALAIRACGVGSLNGSPETIEAGVVEADRVAASRIGVVDLEGSVVTSHSRSYGVGRLDLRGSMTDFAVAHA